MVFEFMNSSINLEVAYIARRVTFTPGLFHDSGIDPRGEDAAIFDFGWGDYEAASYDGFIDDSVFLAGEHS